MIVMIVYTVVFGGLMWLALAQGLAIGRPGLIALLGAVGVGLSVVCTNALTLIEEWSSPRKLSIESILSMLAIFTGAIGSMLVILDLI
ncbi:hypothetical protein NY588_09640 [Curtobacterium flaccumfaciens pv. beticola]|uniref:hypothetical protein n=1 Tax=Curtobacterium flaccumfaciens TaxID=2035 RepID=UPI00349F909B|nr:hypothetical protein [Curtobacterium flaccumfaciens pv. basellae]